MSVTEVARYLNLHLMTVYRYLHSGDLPASKVGGRWRVHRRDVENWLASTARGVQKRILVVDDEPEVGAYFKQLLGRHGCRTEVVETAEEALAVVSEREFDLIFLDLLLPGMDGAEAFGEIRKRDPQVPVVLITAYPDSVLVAKALQFGAVSLLVKPFASEEIVRLVRTVRRRTKPTLPQPGGQ